MAPCDDPDQISGEESKLMKCADQAIVTIHANLPPNY